MPMYNFVNRRCGLHDLSNDDSQILHISEQAIKESIMCWSYFAQYTVSQKSVNENNNNSSKTDKNFET